MTVPHLGSPGSPGSTVQTCPGVKKNKVCIHTFAYIYIYMYIYIFFFQQLRHLVPFVQDQAQSLIQSCRVLWLKIRHRSTTVIHPG